MNVHNAVQEVLGGTNKVATYLSVKIDTVIIWIKNGKIPCCFVEKLRNLSIFEIDKLVLSDKVGDNR